MTDAIREAYAVLGKEDHIIRANPTHSVWGVAMTWAEFARVPRTSS